MRQKKVKTNYEKLKMDDLHTLAGKVVTCMQDNSLFPDLPVDIEILESLADNFQRCWETAKDGGSKMERSLRDEARTALLEAFRKTANYVNQMARGQLPALLSSGFELESDRTPLRPTDPPSWVKLTDGPQKNQLLLRFEAVKNVTFYEYQYTKEVDTEGKPKWEETFQTRKATSNILAPTEPGHIYYVRIRTRNGTGPSDWSNIASLLAR